MPDVPSGPDDPVAALRAVAAGLREIIEAKDEMLAARDTQVAALTAQVAALAARIAELERRLGRDSSNSSRPPSSDGPYDKKQPRDRSLRERGQRKPGRQPGAPSATLRQAGDPDETVRCSPAECSGCGAGLAGAAVTATQRLQVFEVAAPPPPRVTGYQVQARQCGRCGIITAGRAPGGVSGRAQYGPETSARAATLVAGHYIPVARAAVLMGQLTGAPVSAGWMAGIRGKAAALVEASGFTDHVAGLLKAAPAVHADETPARAAGGTRYVHLACTRYLTAMHAGDRSAAAIDAGGVLPGYEGIIVRDGYAGYSHLTDALHAWCGVHLLRDLKGLYDFEPASQEWASKMAGLLIEARDAAAAARLARQAALDPAVLDDIVARYRELATAGLTGNLYRRTATATDARRLARRFRDYEDMILRFATRPDLDIFSNNEAERTIRPVKVQQRGSGGCWRTLDGLAEFAIVQSYLSTASKWGISALEALRDLFNGHAWLPPGLEPG